MCALGCLLPSEECGNPFGAAGDSPLWLLGPGRDTPSPSCRNKISWLLLPGDAVALSEQ